MSFGVGVRVTAAVLAAVVVSALSLSASAADTKRPAASKAAVAPEPSGAELVGKLLRDENGPSDPDVPLPQRDLSASQGPNSTPLPGPQVFGRREDGGGVFGMKFPIPVTRGASN